MYIYIYIENTYICKRPYKNWNGGTALYIYVRPSKLVTCLNDDGCFEGVPSLATVLAIYIYIVLKLGVSLPDTGMLLQSKHEHSKGGISLLKGSHRYAQF